MLGDEGEPARQNGRVGVHDEHGELLYWRTFAIPGHCILGPFDPPPGRIRFVNLELGLAGDSTKEDRESSSEGELGG